MADQPDQESTAQQLADLLRAEIVSGRLMPGTRLRSRHELVRHNRCSGRTLQQAMAVLTHEGFLHTVSRQATLVHPRPPHRHRILVPFLSRPTATSPRWPSFFDLLWRMGAPVGERLGLEIRPVADVQDDPFQKEAAALVEQAAHRCCAGVLLTILPRFQPQLFDALRRTGIPLAVIGSGSEGIPGVILDETAWWREAVRTIVQRGKRRVAVVCNHRQDDDAWLAALHRAFSQHGLDLPEYLIHEVPIGLVPEQRRLGLRLGHLSEPPEAVLVLDDNLVEGVGQGLRASPLRPLLVAHANFPDPPPAPLPCLRFGPDVAETLAIGCRLLLEPGDRRSVPTPLVLTEQRPSERVP